MQGLKKWCQTFVIIPEKGFLPDSVTFARYEE